MITVTTIYGQTITGRVLSRSEGVAVVKLLIQTSDGRTAWHPVLKPIATK
jgi:hypothetical protein